MSQYRDPLAGLVSQVATKRAALADAERRLSPAARAMLPSRLASVLDELGPRARAPAEDLATLSAADATLDALLAAYEEALSLAPELCACPDEVPDPPPPTSPQPFLLEEPWNVRQRKRLEERVAAIDPGASIRRWGDLPYLARLRAAGAPMVLLVDFTYGGQSDWFWSQLATSLPAALPPLRLEPEGLARKAAHALGLAQEIETGELSFDHAFWLTGSAATASLLVPSVRHALVVLAGAAVKPSLLIEHGRAVLRWNGVLRADGRYDVLPAAALDVLAGLRQALEPA